jgi:uncharacterized protein
VRSAVEAERPDGLATSVHASAPASPPPWTVLRIVTCTALVGLVLLVSQMVGAFVVLVVQVAAGAVRDYEALATSGAVLVGATCASALICVPFTRFLVGRHEAAPWTFLGFRTTSARTMAAWCAALVACVAATDLLTIALGRPIVLEFMSSAYASAPPALLFLALVVAAPIFEELFFRGFLLSTLASRGVPVLVAAVLSSALWAGIHFQYDAYAVLMIFVMGLLLAAARAMTRSIYPCIAMHALANAIAFAETAFVANFGPF